MKKWYIFSLVFFVFFATYSVRASKTSLSRNVAAQTESNSVVKRKVSIGQVKPLSKLSQKISLNSIKTAKYKKAYVPSPKTENYFKKDVTVLNSTSRSIEFLYTPDNIIKSELPHYTPSSYQEQIPEKSTLPIKYVTIGVPIGATVRVEVVEAITVESTGVDIPPIYEITGGNVKGKASSQDGFLPSAIASVEEQALYRGQEIVKIGINPFRYNPNSKTLLFYKSLRVKVNFYGGDAGVAHQDRFFEKVFESVLLNYEQAKNWKKESETKKLHFYTNNWYKVEVKEEGIYKIDTSQVDLSGVDLSTVRLYNGGSKMVIGTSDTLKEVPIYILPNNSILFYGTSLDGWGKNDLAFLNPYASTNVYWLTYGGGSGRRDSISGSSVQNAPAYFFDTLHIEKDSICPAKSGLAWVWDKLERISSVSSLKKDYTFDAHSCYNDSCKIKFAVYGWYTDMSQYKPEATDMNHNIKLYLNGVEFYNTSWIGPQEYPPKFFEFDASGFHDGTDTVTIELYKGSSMTKDVIFFDYFEVVCKKKYEAYTGNLKFSGEDSLAFTLKGFQSSPVIFNITNPLDPKRVANVDFDTGVVSFQCPGGVYYASDSFKIPVIKEESPYNIRNMSQNLDFIIIAHPDFINYANTLKTYREWQGLSTEVFSTVDIYNNFSWGIENSPYAIKNFLSYAYDNWGQPGYCLLLGAGTYAYKSDVSKNRIPAREEGYKVGEYGYPPQGNYCWDDWFSQHNLAVGRITAKTKIEAENAIDKITKYEKADQGVWKNRILLISDDEYPDRDMFVANEERCANMIPQEYDVFKVYSMNYPLETCNRKPTAENDIIRHIDKGMNMVLAAGHGNLYLFCHEILFYNPQDIEVLNNGVKNPIWQFWSCGIGCFDRMDDDCMADYLQKIPNKGTIASIAATRTTGGSSGMDTLLVNLLLKQKLNTLGQVVYGQNLSRNLQVNENLFADPATRFPSWSINVEIDSFSDTLMGGTMLEIEGTAPNANFAHITVRSSEYNYTYVYHGYPGIEGNTKYKMRGRMVDNQLCEDILFEGITEVTNGKWKESFYIPKLDSIQDSLLWGAYGKISVFAWNDTSCGNAATPVTIMPGGDNPGDTVGPAIQLFVNGVSMGDTINTAEFMFSALLEDESGINVFNKIVPYNLALTLRIKNGQLLPRNIQLADYFQYDTGSCTRGSISYQLSLSEGEDTLELQASDNLKNRTVFSTIVVVGVEETDTLTKLFSFNQNSSNPFIKSTIISYQIPLKSNVSLKLFDLSGRCVKTLIECEKLPGRYEEKLEFKDYPAGIYFVKFNAGTYNETKKIVLIK